MKPPPEEPDYYLNEAGLLVMTRTFLLRRGYCCGAGCLHCPYDYVRVPEPRRSRLLQARTPPPPSNESS